MEAWLIGRSCALTALSDGAELRFDARCRGDFSAFCLGGRAEGVFERGLSYGLEDAELTPDFPLAVSNSFTGEPASISVTRGRLIVYWQDDPALPLPERRYIK